MCTFVDAERMGNNSWYCCIVCLLVQCNEIEGDLCRVVRQRGICVGREEQQHHICSVSGTLVPVSLGGGRGGNFLFTVWLQGSQPVIDPFDL